MNHNWNYPTLMWVGENRINDLVDSCQELKISNPLFVTDKDLINLDMICLLYTSPSPRDRTRSRMPSSA